MTKIALDQRSFFNLLFLFFCLLVFMFRFLFCCFLRVFLGVFLRDLIRIALFV